MWQNAEESGHHGESLLEWTTTVYAITMMMVMIKL